MHTQCSKKQGIYKDIENFNTASSCILEWKMLDMIERQIIFMQDYATEEKMSEKWLSEQTFKTENLMQHFLALRDHLKFIRNFTLLCFKGGWPVRMALLTSQEFLDNCNQVEIGQTRCQHWRQKIEGRCATDSWWHYHQWMSWCPYYNPCSPVPYPMGQRAWHDWANLFESTERQIKVSLNIYLFLPLP